MPFKNKKGNLSSTSSLQSLISSVDTSLKEEFLPQPSNLSECDDQLQTYQILLQGKSKRKTELIQNLKHLRSEKEPLLKVKETLQEEVSASNQLINAKSEEVTQIKHKLRHHSERQIQDNIERLEMQLRNNNYKPKEEQKILDEIFVLKKSFKSLKEFELKQMENKKYREERSRLIEQRNEVFFKVQAIFFQEEEIKREITQLKHIIHSSKRNILHLKTLRPELEFIFADEKKKKEACKLKNKKEKVKIKREQSFIRQNEREKSREKYQASTEPYEEEKNICKRLLAYLKTALPADHYKNDSSETEIESCVSTVSALYSSSQSPLGSFYSKPKYYTLENTLSKKKKLRDKKKAQKANKIRELSHPPDVLNSLLKFNFPFPKTTDDVSHCIYLTEQKLKYYDTLCEKKEKLGLREKINKVDEISLSNNLPCLNSSTEKGASDSGGEKICDKKSEVVSPFVPISINDSLLHASNTLCKDVAKSDSNYNRNNNDIISSDCKLSFDQNSSTSYFSSVASDSHHPENSLGPTYASVAARIKV